MINDLLNEISLIYKSIKLRFSVNQYEDILLRMLTPVELNAYINQNEINLLFETTPKYFDEEKLREEYMEEKEKKMREPFNNYMYNYNKKKKEKTNKYSTSFFSQN